MRLRNTKLSSIVALGVLLGFWCLPWRLAFGAAKHGKNEISRMSLSVTVPMVPAPTGVCSGSVAHCAIISWTAPTTDTSGNTLTGTLTYDVYRSTTNGTGYVKVTSSQLSAATYEDAAVTGGVTYYYVIVAYQTVAGSAESSASGFSSQVSVTGLPIPIPNPPTGARVVSVQ